ncbi:MAG: hypothetical protein LBU99_02095, partial [Spirochaetaceae bacterium]|nr:hypothetical protein [Spirochaetaceae bacterium]
MNNEKILVSRGEVVGIGKVKVFPSKTFAYEIPMLSFIVIRDSETPDRYVATCIHLHLDGYGNTQENAYDDMKRKIIDFLDDNFTNEKIKDFAWHNLEDLFEIDEWGIELWNAYRRVQLKLARKGERLDMVSDLMDMIAKLEKQISKLNVVKDQLEREIAGPV